MPILVQVDTLANLKGLPFAEERGLLTVPQSSKLTEQYGIVYKEGEHEYDPQKIKKVVVRSPICERRKVAMAVLGEGTVQSVEEHTAFIINDKLWVKDNEDAAWSEF